MSNKKKDLYYLLPRLALLVCGGCSFIFVAIPEYYFLVNIFYGIAFLFMVYNVFKRTKHLKLRRYEALIFVLGLLMIFESNFRSGWGFSSRCCFAICILFCLNVLQNKDARNSFAKILNNLLVLYLIYAAVTCICYVVPDFYEKHILSWYAYNSTGIMRQIRGGGNPGLTNHFSTNGMLMSAGFCIAFSKLIVSKTKKNMAMVAYIYFSLLLTGKRAHFIFCTFIAFYIYYLSQGSKKTLNKWIRVGFVVLTATTIGYFFIVVCGRNIGVFGRWIRLLDTDDVSNGRMILWISGIQSYLKNPIFGIGWMQFRNIIGTVIYLGKTNIDTHNVYLQLLCETGLIGALVFYTWFVFLYCLTMRLYKKQVEYSKYNAKNNFLLCFSLLYQSFFLLYCMTGNPLYDTYTFVPYFISCAIALNYMVLDRKVRIENNTILGLIRVNRIMRILMGKRTMKGSRFE